MSKLGKTAQLAKNAGILAVGSFSSKLLTFFMVPLYTAVLTTGEYGSYDIISSTVSLLIPVLTLNISDALLRFPLEEGADVSRIARIGIAVTVASAVPVLLAQLLPGAPWSDLDGVSYLAALYLSTASYQSLTVLARGLNRMGDIAVAGVVSTLVIIVLNLLLLLVAGWGIDGYFVANIVGFAVPAAYLAFRMRREIFAAPMTRQPGLARKMVRYSLPLATAVVGWWFVGTSDRYVVLAFCGAAANGLYSVAYKIPSILNTVSSIFTQAWQVSAIKEFDRDDSDGFLRGAIHAAEAVTVLACGVLIPFSPVLAGFLFSGEFYEAWRYVPLLLVYSAFGSMAGMWGPFFSANYDTFPLGVSTAISGAVNLVASLMLVPAVGVQGACVAGVLAGFSNWAVRYVLVRKHLGVSFRPARSLAAFGVLTAQSVPAILGITSVPSGIFQLACLAVLVISYRGELASLVFGIRRKVPSGFISSSEK